MKTVLTTIFSIFSIQASNINLDKQDYFDIAKGIIYKNNGGGKKMLLTNILKDHIKSSEKKKSSFYTQDENQLSLLIEEVVNYPDHCEFSRSSGKLMVLKDFASIEVSQYSRHAKYIGCHINSRGELIQSNRVVLIFDSIEKVILKSKPWNFTDGVALTGYPDHPTRAIDQI